MRIADRHHIMSIPQFAVFVNGKPGRKLAGEMPQRRVESLIRTALKKVG